MQSVLLGSGDSSYEQEIKNLANRLRGKTAVRIGYDQALAHRIESASDFYLMPSRFEPCGLNQMYSLRYGSVPIVRRTGGLDDTVVDILDDAQLANGIKFSDYSSHALAKAIRKALVLFEDKPLLKVYRQNGMAADFCWNNSVQKFTGVYKRLRG